MQTLKKYTQGVSSYLTMHRTVRSLVAYCVILFTVASVIAGGVLTASFAHASYYCSSSDAVYTVKSGDTLGLIAWRYKTTYQRLQSYNKIPNANIIYVAEHICIPQASATKPAPLPPTTPTQGNVPHGTSNVFPYPSCTWWASQRFYQMHGYYVPWTTNSNAYQWTDRAYNFGWRVSSQPHVGAIIDLQPWVQGAYGYGHVAVVESVMGNGYFVGSNTNWGAYPYNVQYVTFHVGSGVTFIG